MCSLYQGYLTSLYGLIFVYFQVIVFSNIKAIYRIHPSSSTHGDHLATLPASRVVLKNFQQGVLTDTEWLQVRRRWIRRLGERWDKNEDKAVVLDLVQQFFPSHRIVSSLWSLRRIIGKKFHTRLMHSYCQWMAE